MAGWYLAVDMGRGQPFYTPSVLGQVFAAGDTTPAVHAIAPQAVAEFLLLHFGIFLLLGVVLIWLTHMARRNPALRMGVWLGIVISFVFFLGFLFVLYSVTHKRFPWQTALAAASSASGP